MSDKLVRNLEAMLAKGRDNALLRFGLGNHYFTSKDYPQALTHFEQCLVHDPQHSAAWKLKGRCLHLMGDTVAANTAYQQALIVAQANGDKQISKELAVFIRKLSQV